MITGFLFENYKAFAKGSIDLKPITILIGANSSGKSSITHLPLLLYQTANSEQKYQLPIRKRMFDTNGFMVKMGDLKSIIKNKDSNNFLSLKFRFESNKNLDKNISDIRADFHDMIWETFRAYSVVFREIFEKEVEPEELKRVTEANAPEILDKEFRKIVLEALRAIRDRVQAASPDTIETIVLKRYSRSRKGLVFRKDIKIHEDYQWSSQFVDMLDSLCGEEFIISFSLAYLEKRKDFAVQRVTLENSQSPIMSFEFEIENGDLLDVTIPSWQSNSIVKYKSLISKIFDLKSDKSIFDIMGNYSFVSNDPLFPELLSRFVNIFFNEFRDSFSESTFNYVGPLREYPQKYYIRVGNYHGLSVLSNYEIAELLADNPSLLERTNQWLAYFATRVGIDETQEDVRRIRAIRNELDYDLDISNVGFGISQILPVVVQTLLSPSYSVTIVEQPEVHLHPNMQAKLADLFIDTVYNFHNQCDSKRKLLIETHSVAFLNRLRLRIAQKKIQKDDIAIYSFSVNSKNEGRIDQIPILDGSDFDWPEDFIEEELMDSIELAKIISGAT